MSLQIIKTEIEGCQVELQPMFGDLSGAVFHMLPGGKNNPEGFGDILDVYACTAKGKGILRGGHYHKKLDEFFFTSAGTSLWILSDFRETSSTYKKTTVVVLSLPKIETDFQTFCAEDESFPRLRVPNGVYHTFFPLTDERVLITALGSTSHDKEDYVYPTLDEIPNLQNVLGDDLYHLIKK